MWAAVNPIASGHLRKIAPECRFLCIKRHIEKIDAEVMSRGQHRSALRATKAGNRMARCHRPCEVLIETARIAVPQIVVATERGAREPDVGVRHLMQLHDRPARRLHQSPTVMLSNRPARGKAHQGGTRGQSGRRCGVCVRWLGWDADSGSLPGRTPLNSPNRGTGQMAQPRQEKAPRCAPAHGRVLAPCCRQE